MSYASQKSRGLNLNHPETKHPEGEGRIGKVIIIHQILIRVKVKIITTNADANFKGTPRVVVKNAAASNLPRKHVSRTIAVYTVELLRNKSKNIFDRHF